MSWSTALRIFLWFLIRERTQSQSFETIVNHSLPFGWSEGISFIYDHKLTLLGGANMLNELYTLDLSSIQLTDNNTKILPSSFNANLWQKHSTKYPSFGFASSTSNYTKDGISSIAQQFSINGDRIYIAAPDPNLNYGLSDFLIFDMTQNQFIDPESYDSEGAEPDLWSSCVTNNYTHVFVLGGTSNTQKLVLNRIYNIQSDSWSEGATMIEERALFACEHNFARDVLYALGGWRGSNTRLDSIEKYDIASDTWTLLDPATLSSNRNRFRCILDDIGQINIYCVGGYNGGVQKVMDIFDTNSETVSPDNTALPFGCDTNGMAFYNLNGNGILFSIGGGTGGASADLDVIQYTIIAAPSGPTTPPTMKPTLFPTTTPPPTLDGSIYQFNAFDESVFSLPTVMKDHFAYVYDNKLNIFGGFDSGTSSPILNKRFELDLSAIDFESYFVDNTSSQIDETLLSLENMNSKWNEVPMSFPKDIYEYTNYSTSGISCSGSCVTIIAPLMYIVNGRYSYENRNMIVYNMSSSSFVSQSAYNWTLESYTIAPCVTNDGWRIYVIGGYEWVGSTKEYQTQTQIYSIGTDSWALGDEFSVGRAYHGCSINKDKTYVFIFGGTVGNTETDLLDSIEQYDINADQWSFVDTELNTPLISIIECINDDISDYTDHILCFGGSDFSQFRQSINIFDPDSLSMQIVSNGLALGLLDSALTVYNLPNNGMLWFMTGGKPWGATLSNRIQYLRFVKPPPTESPTSDPTIDPTIAPTFDPTLNPTYNPLSPTLSPTGSLYHIYWIKTSVPEATMIEPSYQTNTIHAIESILNVDYTIYALDYVSTVVCSDEEQYGWQYISYAVENEMDQIEDSLNDASIQSKIEIELGNMDENTGYNIKLIAVDVRDEAATKCDDEDSMNDDVAVLGYFVLGFVVVLLLFLVILSFIVHCGFKGSDTPDYMSLFRYCANLGDFWSDIIFVLHLNAVGSALFIWALLFTLIPYSFSIILLITFIYIIKTAKTDGPYMMIAKYLHKHDFILISLSLIGGLFPSLYIVSSKLFHLEIFSMDLRSDQMAKMQIVRFFNISALENLPQLVIQILFVGSRGLKDSVTIISMFFSILSLLMGIIQTISTSLDQRSSNTQTQDVSRKMSDWLRTDTVLGDMDEGDMEQKEERTNTVKAIKEYPNMLFHIKIRCNDLTKHHRYTKYSLTQLISAHIQMDATCLELFGFNMNTAQSELQFYVEISLIKVMRFVVDLNNIKFTRIKNNMLSLSQTNENKVFVEKMMKKLKLKASVEEIVIGCDYIDSKSSEMISLSPRAK